MQFDDEMVGAIMSSGSENFRRILFTIFRNGGKTLVSSEKMGQVKSLHMMLASGRNMALHVKTFNYTHYDMNYVQFTFFRVNFSF
jgi:hypothetical protein